MQNMEAVVTEKDPQVVIPRELHTIIKAYAARKGMILAAAAERVFRRGLKEMGLLPEEEPKP
jgi:tRNA U34 5-methylaminomethyl-2-thiouridine-forming methyltransferase MnmC